MAKKTVVFLTDDLTGEEIREGQGQTVEFALDGTAYIIDLSKQNAGKLREAFSQYVGASRKTGGKPDGRRKSEGPTRLYDPKIIRRWAEQEGVELPKRGRIPQRIIGQFEADEEAKRSKPTLFSES